MSGLVTIEKTEAQWKHQASIYHREYGISHSVGSLDGTYIQIRNIGDRTNWICRKRYPAINMTIMVDASGLICYVSCRWPGSMHDSTVYRNTDLYRVANRPPPGRWEPFPGAVVLADSAYIGIVGDNLLLAHPRFRRLTAQNARFYQ
uniref:DDE Tnp4 domain-containing protein n=1 Tax=Panagrolaimus superbus TaxID=310955 RepID=A0A914Y8G0_9BILA